MAKKTIIVPGHERKAVMKKLLKDGSLLFGSEVLPLTAYKSSLVYRQLDPQREMAELFSTVREGIRKENIYRSQLRFPVFFHYFYAFACLLASSGITSEQLPDRDPDKKEILAFMLERGLSQQKLHDEFEKITDASDLEVRDSFYPDYSDARDISFLLEKGARLIAARELKNTRYRCHVANNNAREIIGIAQYLVEKKRKDGIDLKDYVLMVTDKANYYPLIKRVFEYYKIPFVLSYARANHQAVRYSSFLKLLRKQDAGNFVDAYVHGAFGDADYRLCEYIEQFSLTYQQLLEPFVSAERAVESDLQTVRNTFGEKKVKELARRQKCCEELMKPIREILTSEQFIAMKDDSLQNQCDYCYRFLYGGKTFKDQKEIDEIQSVHDLIEVIASQKGDEENLSALLCYELERLQTEKTISYQDGLVICDPYENVTDAKTAIIVGCYQQIYPRTVACSGFFDEDYISEIRDYPSLVKRSEHFDREYRRFLRQFEEVIFSYPAGTVDGSQYQRSIFISDFPVEKDSDGEVVDISWPYSQSETYSSLEEKITEETAEKIYLDKGGCLPATPSSFGTYVGCPFRYFLEKGLNLSDEQEIQIGADTIGNIQHSLLERYFNDEFVLDESNIAEKLEPYFELMKKLMVNDGDEIEAMKNRLAQGLKGSVSFLAEFRENDSYSEYHPENQINYRFVDNGIRMNINGGRIDRLDVSGDKYRIIDYKSSEKTVTFNKVKKGINFQLLAYLVFYYLQQKEKGFDLKPQMFSYLSLKNATLKAKDEDKNHQLSDSDIRNKDIKYLSYQAANTSADERFFDLGNLSGRNTSDPEKKKFTFDEVQDIIMKLYGAIGKDIMAGKIDIAPTNNYCTFCHFNDICHHSKDETTAESQMKNLVDGEGE